MLKFKRIRLKLKKKRCSEKVIKNNFFQRANMMKQLTAMEEAELTSRVNGCPGIVCMFEIEDPIFQMPFEYVFMVVLN